MKKGGGGSHGVEGLGCELLGVQYAVGHRGPGVELLVFFILFFIILLICDIILYI